MKRNDRRLTDLVKQIQDNDKSLGKELKGFRKKSGYKSEAATIAKSIAPKSKLESLDGPDDSDALESIVLRIGRPVLTIKNNLAQLVFTDVESEVWKTKLKKAEPKLTAAIQAVGRIELGNHALYDWVGTGWLVANDIIVTNRHVAELFTRQSGSKFIFRQGNDTKEMRSSIDLLEEAGVTAELAFKITDVLFVEPEPGPDIAFFKVEALNGSNKLPSKISLSKAIPNKQFEVAVIGYPAKDSRVPDQALMERLFGKVYDKKRLSPGQVTQANATRLFHDCSTLGGNSGSAVIDLQTGKAVGLHFAGRFLESNMAVPAPLVEDRLKRLKTGRELVVVDTIPTVASEPSAGVAIVPVADNGNVQSISMTIPLSITINTSNGTPVVNVSTTGVVQSGGISSRQSMQDLIDDSVVELKVSDLADRKGYIETFLGASATVKLPVIKDAKWKKDILTYKNGTKNDTVLRYQHFSVVMSKSRRLCFFSAVNLNGAKSKKATRVGWKLDPRIPVEAQIKDECYGDPPKFSRGHMTRREDPVWGGETEAMQGNSDSMVVTNAVPQMQKFNAPIWLALEDHALNHARSDKMQISVFTGPIMKSNDPVIHGVKIPVTFWKVIAFIHDETGKLCATGYKMSQTEQLPDAEFIFGKFGTAQVAISWIEKQTGLSFGNLASKDPMGGGNESIAAGGAELGDVAEVKFV